jgi:hypothetical protein
VAGAGFIIWRIIQFANLIVFDLKGFAVSARSMRRQTCSWKPGGSAAGGFHSFSTA